MDKYLVKTASDRELTKFLNSQERVFRILAITKIGISTTIIIEYQ